MAYFPCNVNSNLAKSVTFTVGSCGGSSTEHYFSFELPNTHKFKELKIIAYRNLGSNTTHPYFIINGTRYNKPNANTVYDIENKSVRIVGLNQRSDYVYTEIDLELIY